MAEVHQLQWTNASRRTHLHRRQPHESHVNLLFHCSFVHCSSLVSDACVPTLCSWIATRNMTALPPIPEARRLIPPLDNSVMSLYASLVLPAEQAASKAANAKDLMYSRVVGYLLYPPNPTALAALKHDVASCNTTDQGPLKAIYDLG